ncbi:hypothetical protein F3J10_24715 [Burkholderia sp. Cy-637]|nr:hypothetical protein [Burkholderia sp. Cy-637]
MSEYRRLSKILQPLFLDRAERGCPKGIDFGQAHLVRCQTDCAACSMKQRCCPNTPMREIARSVH